VIWKRTVGVQFSTTVNMESAPRKGTDEGDFFHRPENRFRNLDSAREPAIDDAQDELETNV
jgi:hypothetical protein